MRDEIQEIKDINDLLLKVDLLKGKVIMQKCLLEMANALSKENNNSSLIPVSVSILENEIPPYCRRS